MEKNKIYHGDSKEVLKTFPDNYFHSIVTDPPYEIGFMGKGWDSTGIAYDIEFWKECLRVLRPGGFLLSFSATSTYHRMATAIEQAGFEIRDKIDVFYDGNRDMEQFLESLDTEQRDAFSRLINQQNETGLYSWLYGQGMPKGQNVGKAIQKVIPEEVRYEGFNTSLKPANEPICMARKPIEEKTVAQNMLVHGVGAINIDACRIQRQENDRFEYGVTGNQKATTGTYGIYGHYTPNAYVPHEAGRFPSNIMTDERTAEILEEQHKESSRFFFKSKATKRERQLTEPLLQLRKDLTEKERNFILQEMKRLGKGEQLVEPAIT